MNEIIIPSIVRARLAEAEATPSIPRWRSLSEMCSSMVVNASVYAPGSPIVDELRRIAYLAHNNMLAMQPQREEAA
ncbi:MAG: hypothetical protein WA085_13335 [Sphingobium sp.]